MTPSQISMYIKYLNKRSEDYKGSSNRIDIDSAIEKNAITVSKVSNKASYYEKLKKKVISSG